MDDYKKEFFCELLEDSMDKQYDLDWSEREWDTEKLRSYIACCFALPFFVKNDSEVLARILRCFCDAESGGVQEDLARACESYSDDPYGDETFVNVVVKAAPEMLRKSPKWFGDTLFSCVASRQVSRPYFLGTFQSFEKQEDQKIIVDYLTYQVERFLPKTYRESEFKSSNDFNILNECLQISGLKKGNSDFFWESTSGLQFKPTLE